MGETCPLSSQLVNFQPGGFHSSIYPPVMAYNCTVLRKKPSVICLNAVENLSNSCVDSGIPEELVWKCHIPAHLIQRALENCFTKIVTVLSRSTRLQIYVSMFFDRTEYLALQRLTVLLFGFFFFFFSLLAGWLSGKKGEEKGNEVPPRRPRIHCSVFWLVMWVFVLAYPCCCAGQGIKNYTAHRTFSHPLLQSKPLGQPQAYNTGVPRWRLEVINLSQRNSTQSLPLLRNLHSLVSKRV